jgi:hypothetical protein
MSGDGFIISWVESASLIFDVRALLEVDTGENLVFVIDEL